MENKNRYKTYGAFIVMVLLFGFFSTYSIQYSNAQTLTGNTALLDLNDELRNIKQTIKDLEDKREKYEEEVDELKKQSLSLQREISLLDNRIAQLGLDIDTEQARIDQTGLEIQSVDLDIAIAKKEINNKKVQLGSLLNRLGRFDDADYLKILLFNDTFADFFDGVKYIESIESDVFIAVQNVKGSKDKLNRQKDTLEEKKYQLEILIGGLEEKKLTLVEEDGRKSSLLSTTRLSERKFQQLILELKKERNNANADIISLERQIRDKLTRDNLLQGLGGDENFLWPVNPSGGITTYFHDPTYPYRYLFEHPGLDIRASQGTQIRAMKSGYVGRAKDAGLGYSYIVIIHDNDFTSVYGHVSQISVREDDFVVQGQVIGSTGGAPGTKGAGNLSTGPHMHMEIRQRGIPINPLDYLP